MKTYTCCLCNKNFEGYGNNPLPLYNNEGKCCDMCNITQVLPIRLMLKNFKDGKNEKHLHNDEE
jgi:hypothetical protein